MSSDEYILERAKSLATWPVRMMLPLNAQTKCVDTGGGVDKLLRGDSDVKIVKLFLELSMPLIMLYNNRFSHGKAAIQ